jgi:hypothetical protein
MAHSWDVMSYMRDELRSAESLFKDECMRDRDSDGTGEFGTLADILAVAERIRAADDFAREVSKFRHDLDEAKV